MSTNSHDGSHSSSQDSARVEAAGRSAGPPQARPAPSGGSAAHEVANVGASGVWPYPRWIAHRGAGKLAPENTLAAFALGARHGYRMFECDVKLSADDVPFLLHDATLERTTNGAGVAGEQPWQALATLDAGSWHSKGYAREPLPAFESIARWCREQGHFLNIEIKPSPGQAARTGQHVADMAARLWEGAAVPPLLTSFEPTALAAAIAAQPQLPRGLLLHTLPPDWLAMATALRCAAIVCHHPLWNADTAAQAKNAGFRLLSYTVNEAADVQRLLDLGIDGIITDRVDVFRPDR